MTLTAAAALANILNFIMFLMIAVWYVAPWLASRPRAEALTVLLWAQAFRDVALQIFSAQHFGFAARHIAAGEEDHDDKDHSRHRRGLQQDRRHFRDPA